MVHEVVVHADVDAVELVVETRTNVLSIAVEVAEGRTLAIGVELRVAYDALNLVGELVGGEGGEAFGLTLDAGATGFVGRGDELSLDDQLIEL